MASDILDNKPPLPPIEDIEGVVEWFLRHDTPLSESMKFAASKSAGIFWEIRTECLRDLNRFSGADRLAAHASSLEAQWQDVLRQAQTLIAQHGGPDSVPDSKQNELEKLAIGQALLAARIRILVHFLKEQYGSSLNEAQDPDENLNQTD